MKREGEMRGWRQLFMSGREAWRGIGRRANKESRCFIGKAVTHGGTCSSVGDWRFFTVRRRASIDYDMDQARLWKGLSDRWGLSSVLRRLFTTRMPSLGSRRSRIMLQASAGPDSWALLRRSPVACSRRAWVMPSSGR